MMMEMLKECRRGIQALMPALVLSLFAGSVGCANLPVALAADPLAAEPVAAESRGAEPGTFSRGFSDIVAKVQPAVVNVAVSEVSMPDRPRRLPPGPFGGPPGGPPMRPPGPPRPFGGPPGASAGSGVIIDSAGYIVTNNHVVEHGETITVTTFDGKEYPAKVIGTDPKTDLAVIKIEGDNLSFIPWSGDETIRVGDVVLAVGSPFGLKSSVTMGIISAVGRGNVGITEYEDFLQTDAPINPGNSGGPLINMVGEIVGINTAIFSRTGGSEGIGFAIPVVIARDIADSLINTGRVVRGWLGIAIQELTPALAQSFHLPASHTGGVLISEVNARGPSAGGELQRGDVLLEYRGDTIRDINHLRNVVARTPVGSTVEVIVLRDGERRTLSIGVGERPTDDMLARGTMPSSPGETAPDNVLAGLNVGPLTEERRAQLKLDDDAAGVVVDDVESGSEVEAAGIRRGDVIQEVNRRAVSSLDDYRRVADEIDQGELVVVFLSRQGNNLFVAVNPQ